MNLLLTGATGALGHELLRGLARSRPDARLYVLLRAGDERAFQTRAADLRQALGRSAGAAIVPIRGDVSRSRLGLGEQYDGLAGTIDEVYHAAACTRFDMPASIAASHNIGGTRRVIALARAAHRRGRAGRLHYISTAFVAGRRCGRVTEAELDCGQHFSNTYEWSKFQAERDVRAAAGELPITIYRPSVVVGHSRTGRAQRCLGVYQVLQWIDRGYIRTLPCSRDFALDLVPADYVAQAITRLSRLPDSAGRTFHLTAGAGNALSIEELLAMFQRERGASGRRARRGPSGLPRFESPGAARREQRLDRYVPYLSCPKEFDDGQARALLKDFVQPPCREFFPNVARFAIARKSHA